MAKRTTDNEILAAIHGLTVHAVMGPTVTELAARLGVGEATIIRRLGTLLESGRVASAPRFGITLTNEEFETQKIKRFIREGE